MTNVLVNISVIYIDDLDETQMTFAVKLHVKLKWSDSRLTFYNLRDEMKRGNVIGAEEKGEIWFPKLVFTNSLPEIQIQNDDTAVVTVTKEGSPILNENNELFAENEIFKGEENPIVLERYIDLDLRCNFEFSKYPFDQQLCSVLVSLLKSLIPSKMLYCMGFLQT